MIKQELLGCLHSKAKWFAINQLKTVNFNIDPRLDQTDDLNADVEELKYQADFEGYQKPDSVIIGEKYGRKFPVVTIRDLKVEQFWPLVASSAWEDCSSLRVSDGQLLKYLTSTFQQLLDEKLVYQYSTRLYDQVILENRKPCFKNGKPPLLQKKPPKKGKEKLKPGAVRTEVTSISFIYYGTSVEHLLALLHSDGHYDVTAIDVINQNKGRGKMGRQQQHNKMKSGYYRNDLQVLCRGKPVPYKRCAQMKGGLVQDEDAPLGDKFGRKRHLYHRRLSAGFVEWPELEQQENEQDPENELTFFNKQTRREFVEKHGVEGLHERTRLLFFKYLRRKYGTSRDPYEYWWYNSIAIIDALREPRHQVSPTPNTTVVRRNIPSPEMAAPVASTTKKGVAAPSGGGLGKPPLPRKDALLCMEPNPNVRGVRVDPYGAFFARGARNKTNIDRWQCLCDVCTGGLLAHDSLIQLHLHTREEESDEECDDDVDSSRRSPNRMSSRTNRASGRNKKNVKIEVNQSMAKEDSQKSSRNKSSIWFDSVSGYTTPYWDGAKEMAEVYQEFLPNQPPNNLNGKPLNIMYSFDKLRTIKRRNNFSLRQKKLISSLNEDQQKEEPLDYETLKELGILYSYVPDIRKQYRKLAVRKQEADKNSSSKAATSLKVTYTDAKDTSYAGTKRRNTFPPIKKLKQFSDPKLNNGSGRHRAGSFPQVPESAVLITLNNLIPTISGDEKCEVFVNNSPMKVPDGEEAEIGIDLQQRGQKSTIPQMIKQNEEGIPQDFSVLCLAALRIFVIRSETVMVSGNYQHIHSLTVNRHPMCAFPQDYNESKLLTARRSQARPVPTKFSAIIKQKQHPTSTRCSVSSASLDLNVEPPLISKRSKQFVRA